MFNHIKKFWLESYYSDKTAFYFEFVSFIFVVTASSMLAFSANDPDMAVIYPGYFFGSATSCYAAYRRGAAWVMLLTGYFTIINIFGYGRAIGLY